MMDYIEYKHEEIKTDIVTLKEMVVTLTEHAMKNNEDPEEISHHEDFKSKSGLTNLSEKFKPPSLFKKK